MWRMMSAEKTSSPEKIYLFKSEFNSKSLDETSRRILGRLSEDSTEDLVTLADEVDADRHRVARKLNSMKKNLKLIFTVELNESVSNLVSQHIIAVRLRSLPPDVEFASMMKRNIMKTPPIPQFAIRTDGAFDYIIYAATDSHKEYVDWDIQVRKALSKFGVVEWRPSEVALRQLGFVPLRNETLERLEWPKGLGEGEPGRRGSKRRRLVYPGIDGEILKILNDNSRTPLTKIAEMIGQPYAKVHRRYETRIKPPDEPDPKSESRSYVKRFTLVMERIPEGVELGYFFGSYQPQGAKGEYERCSAEAREAFKTDDKYPLVSRYLMTAPLIGSFDLFVLGAFDNRQKFYDHGVEYHKRVQRGQGADIRMGMVREILFGRLPIRSIDIEKAYDVHHWE